MNGLWPPGGGALRGLPWRRVVGRGDALGGGRGGGDGGTGQPTVGFGVSCRGVEPFPALHQSI